jgi:5'-nucleotidase
MTRLLVTNDDGIDAPGLHALAAAARAAGHEVVVAAPLSEASGQSAALTAVTDQGRVVVEKRGPQLYGVAASPAYIVVLAGLGAFGEPPELVLSGVNRGANAGRAVLHSATVGAALTAANNGLRALAVSLDVLNAESGADGDARRHWSIAADVAVGLLDQLADSPAATVFNVNVPDRPSTAGLRHARLATFGEVGMVIAESGEGFVRTTVERTGEPLAPGTDLALLAEGYSTVTALRPPAEDERAPLPVQRARS